MECAQRNCANYSIWKRDFYFVYDTKFMLHFQVGTFARKSIDYMNTDTNEALLVEFLILSIQTTFFGAVIAILNP